MPKARLLYLGNPGSIHVQRWASHFASLGYEVHVLAYSGPKQDIPGVTVHFIRGREPGSITRTQSTGARRALEQLFAGSGLAQPINLLRFWAGGYFQRIRSLAADILHAHYVSVYGFYGAVSGWSPLVLSAWGSDLLVDPHRSPLTRMWVGYALRRAQHVTADCRYVSELAVQYGVPRHKVATIPMGVERKAFEQLCAIQPTGAPIVLSARNLNRLYNIEAVLRAFVLVRRELPDAKLIVVGDGPLRSQLEELAWKLDLRSAVRFEGHVPRRRLIELFAEASVYVSVPFSDATSVSLLEAMAAGLTPVVSDLPGNREWVEHGVNGLVVSPRSTEAIAHAIIEALTNSQLQEVCRIRNRQIVAERAIWEENMAEMEQVYENLLHQTRSVP